MGPAERRQRAVTAAQTRWSKTPAAEEWIDKVIERAPRLTAEQRARISAALAATEPLTPR